jgi:tRNA modification GTPase
MYDVNDTIVAVSTPTSEKSVIVRISGSQTREIFKYLLIREDNQPDVGHKCKIYSGFITVDKDLCINAKIYFFPSPNSYTGDDLTEIHLYTNPAVIEALLEHLVSLGIRIARPGEFTARAYLNGKMDLSQAEAVNEIIVSTNTLQLDASERLLGGGLSGVIKTILVHIMDCMSLFEAGLDFSTEDIEIITHENSVQRLDDIKKELQELISGGFYYDSVMDMPSVGIAGAPNAGKSSLLNQLLGTQRSIVSHHRKTTRDVLTGLLKLQHCRCVLFDCAGLVINPDAIIDQLAQQAAIEELANSSIVLCCIDISKEDWTEDISVRQLINPKVIIPLATKCDLLNPDLLETRLDKIISFFGEEFLAISAETGFGLPSLCNKVDELLSSGMSESQSGLVLTARHRQIITESIACLDDSICHVNDGNVEISAMMLRIAYQNISSIEQHICRPVDEQVLDKIFSRFCIGK